VKRYYSVVVVLILNTIMIMRYFYLMLNVREREGHCCVNACIPLKQFLYRISQYCVHLSIPALFPVTTDTKWVYYWPWQNVFITAI